MNMNVKNNSLTPMQEFALEILKQNPQGTFGPYVGQRWQERNGRRPKSASRDSFGVTSAAYRSIRSLVAMGLAKVDKHKTSGGYTVEKYFPL